MSVAGLEIIHGSANNPTAIRELVKVLKGLNPKGTLYLGYPVLALADERVNVEPLLVTAKFGLVAFLTETLPSEAVGTARWTEIQQRQDHLFGALESFLGRHPSLRTGRRLGLDINTVTLLSAAPPVGAFKSVEGAYTD